ncbi:MAG TPA: type II secretion system F family protein [Acidimicrobiales bacterium]|nr:type II secretion system F family protein [Acidimicrobiales bacterium]
MTETAGRVAVGASLMVWLGATLLLSSSPRFSRPNLVERLRPYVPGGTPRPVGGILSAESFKGLLEPSLRLAGDRLAALFGVAEPLTLRLRRVHSPVSASAFRLRQMTATAIALVAAATVAGATGAPLPVALLLVAGVPLLVFLAIEQNLARQSERWQRSLGAELPVIAEQIAMLLNAGFSLGSALARIATHGQGCAARDLRDVVNRVRQGVSEAAALREWAEVARVDGVHRLVGVLAFGSEAADLGRIVSAEARQARRDLHRRTIELIERRSQQVWVPVTVATLVPGVILLAVPFLAALRLFSNS